MMTPNRNAERFVRSATIAAVLIACAATANTATAQTNKACGLLTAAEIEAGLGFKSTLSPNPGGCMGPTPTHHVVSLELKAATPPGPNDEATFTQFLKAQGIQPEFKKFGPTTCWTGTPQKAGVAFGTSCSITKGAQTATISVTAGAAKDVVPVEKLRLLAEKMAPRL